MKDKKRDQVGLEIYERLAEGSSFSKKHIKTLYQDIDRIKSTERIIPAEINTPSDFSIIERRDIPASKRKMAQRALDEMIKAGYVERAAQSEKWLIPSVVVRKKTSDEVLFTLDLRKVNEVTEKDAYPLPSIKKELHNLSNVVYYSKFSIKDGFFKVPLHTSSYEKTTFRVEDKYYRFRVLPMGYINSHAILQRTVDTVLKNEIGQFCLAYISDVLVYTETLEQHKTVLATVLGKLKRYGLLINWETAEIAQKEVQFFRHNIRSGLIQPNKKELEFSINAEVPNNLRELRQYLGAVGINRKFVPNASETLKILYQLSSGFYPFKWKKEHTDAFLEYREKLKHVTDLAIPNYSEKFIIETFVLPNSIGATLRQGEHVVEYYSKTMNKRHKEYTKKEKNIFAVLSTLKKWHHYVAYNEFIIISEFTSLSNVSTLLSTANLSSRTKYWYGIISRYSIVHQQK